MGSGRDDAPPGRRCALPRGRRGALRDGAESPGAVGVARASCGRAREGNVLVFTATVDRDELIRRRLQGLADKLCGGAAAPLVMNLVRSQPLSAAEVEQLSAFLREQRRR